jgi:glucokinase
MILAGDIGATKVHLALFNLIDGKLDMVRDACFATKDFTGLEEIVSLFAGAGSMSAACFGLPGPKTGERWKMVNLPWTLDRRELAEYLRIQHVYLLNDIEACGHAVASLPPAQLHTLNEGRAERTGNRALVAAGTGLGESFLIWNGCAHVPHVSEGGHVDFAPRNDDECNLLRFLMKKYGGRVSVERVASGIGMTNIYEFLRDGQGMEEPSWLAEEMAVADPNSVIANAALAGRCALCEKTLDMFVSAYGAEAGNFGLTVFSTGGLYIGGGIAPRILEKLKDGTFMQAFTDKGRLSRLVIEMPVHVILDSTAALKGAAAYAQARLAGDATCSSGIGT